MSSIQRSLAEALDYRRQEGCAKIKAKLRMNSIRGLEANLMNDILPHRMRLDRIALARKRNPHYRRQHRDEHPPRGRAAALGVADKVSQTMAAVTAPYSNKPA